MRRHWRLIAAAAMAIAAFAAFGRGAAAQQGFSFGVGFLGDDSRTMFNLFGSQGNTRGIGSVTTTLTTLDGYGGYFSAGSIQPFVTGVVPVVGGQPWYGHSVGRTSSPSYLAARQAAGQSVLAERIARLEAEGEVIGAPSAKRRAAASIPALSDDHERSAASRRRTDFQSVLLADDRSTAAEPVGSIAAIRAEREAAKAEAFRAAAEQFALGKQAEADGKLALAVSYYRIARHNGDEATRRAAQERLTALAARRGK